MVEEQSLEKVWVRVARADVRCSLAQPFACLADHSASVDFDPERPLLRLRSSLTCDVECRVRGILVARCMSSRVGGGGGVCRCRAATVRGSRSISSSAGTELY